MIILLLFILTLLFVVPTAAYSQFTINGVSPAYNTSTNTFLFSISEDNEDKDWTADILMAENSLWESMSIDDVPVEGEFVFESVDCHNKYVIKVTEQGESKVYFLQFTFLPLLLIEGNNFGNDYTDANVMLQSDGSMTEVMKSKIKWRGATTNSEGRNKRNYKIKFTDEDGNKKNYSFLGLRSDNSWILDAGQTDLFRMRNLIAARIWLDMAEKPYYNHYESNIRSATRGQVIELFINNEYRGLYNMCEPIDRKQMKLMKYDADGTIHGQLWKATAYDDALFFSIPDEYDNTAEKNNVWEVKYPKIEDLCPSDYSTLRDAIVFVASSSDEDFIDSVSYYFDIPVMIDYYLFANLTNCFDICGKNVYWAVYDKTEERKMTVALWDLDCTMGQSYYNADPRPDEAASNTPLLVINNLFNRLLQLNVDLFYEKVCERYWTLRDDLFSTESLYRRYIDMYDNLYKSGAVSREENKWSHNSDIDGFALDMNAELSYIVNWIEERMTFLDSQFPHNTATSCIELKNNNSNHDRIFNIDGTLSTVYGRGIKISHGKKYVVK